jgi:hypothetical protein
MEADSLRESQPAIRVRDWKAGKKKEPQRSPRNAAKVGKKKQNPDFVSCILRR